MPESYIRIWKNNMNLIVDLYFGEGDCPGVNAAWNTKMICDVIERMRLEGVA